jgi:hypothetical protein
MAAYQAVVHAGDGDVDVEAYRDGHARYVEGDQIRSLEAQVRYLAGRCLDGLAKAERKKSGSDYRAAFRRGRASQPRDR